MAFVRPTLPELVARIQLDFVSRLTLAGALLRRAVVLVLSRVVAGATHMLHGHLEFLGRQLFPDQSEDAYLVRQASLYGLAKNPATYAQATVDLTGTNGSTAPAGTLLIRADGVEYSTDADATIASGVAAVAVTAVTAGANGTLTPGVSLAFESPVGGVDSAALVNTSTVDGSDQETTEELRVRVLARLADPPQGGTVADYLEWAKEVTGVTRVWVTPLELGPGTVVVRFARDLDASPIPDSGEVATVQTALDAKAPAHATVTAFAPVDHPIPFTLHIVPDSVKTRATVTAELKDLIIREGSPGGTLLLSHLRDTIGNSAGIADYTLTTPSADVVSTTNQLPSLGAITWI